MGVVHNHSSAGVPSINENKELLLEKKKNGVCFGYGGPTLPELHPVEIIHNTPITLLFCRYAKTLLVCCQNHWDACT